MTRLALIKDIPELTEEIANIGNLAILSVYRNPAFGLKHARIIDDVMTGLCLTIMELVVDANQAPPPDRFEQWLLHIKQSETGAGIYHTASAGNSHQPCANGHRAEINPGSTTRGLDPGNNSKSPFAVDPEKWEKHRGRLLKGK